MSDAEIERFRGAIARQLGLSFDESRLPQLIEVLRRRTEGHRESASSFLERLEARGFDRAEVQSLARELTVSETYFFRHFEQFRAFSEVALTERLRARQLDRKLTILSAGCATGEEVYSLAIIASQHPVDATWSVSVRGVDINPDVLEKARRRRYSAWALRETPADLRARNFNGSDRELSLRLEPHVASWIRFDERNLNVEDPELWAPESYDIVFCRNVLMYFDLEPARSLMTRVARALVPGGYLFVGHAETLRGLSQDFHLCHTHGTFYYRRKLSRPSKLTTSVAHFVERKESELREEGHEISASSAWTEDIKRATDRVRRLTEAIRPEPPEEAEVLSSGASSGLGPALGLLRAERFADALASLPTPGAGSTPDPDALLLRAVLLIQDGQLAAAEQACVDLLEVDELTAGAHYLLALVCAGRGENQAAIEHDQVAAYLDPSFAMARLHLGLLARRAGDREGARRELTHALPLLEREDASRILLFGGGFQRPALLALCRAELEAVKEHR